MNASLKRFASGEHRVSIYNDLYKTYNILSLLPKRMARV
jgi:hypothetical protein